MGQERWGDGAMGQERPGKGARQTKQDAKRWGEGGRETGQEGKRDVARGKRDFMVQRCSTDLAQYRSTV